MNFCKSVVFVFNFILRSTDEKLAERELHRAQGLYCNAINHLKKLRCKVARYEAKLEDLKLEEEVLIQQLEEQKGKCAENAETLSKLTKEMNEQKQKIERANREIQTLLKTIKQRGISAEYLELFERDLNLQELETRNRKALNLLSDMAASDTDGTKIIRFMLSKGLKMPTQLKPVRSGLSSKSTSYTSIEACSTRGMIDILLF